MSLPFLPSKSNTRQFLNIPQIIRLPSKHYLHFQALKREFFRQKKGNRKLYRNDAVVQEQVKCLMSLGKDYYIDGQNTQLIYFLKNSTGGGKQAPKLHPGGGLFGPWSFIILKNSHQDLSNEGSNFILSSLEVGHWAAQTQPFLTNYLKLQIFASI